MTPMVRMVATVIGIALTLRPAKATGQPRRGTPVPRQIVEQLLRDTVFIEEFTDRFPLRADSLAANLVAETLHLDGNRTPELEIRGINSLCGINNCPEWIYRQDGHGYERLLDASGIEGIEPQRTVSHGYRDIITSRHESAWDSDLTLYQFDGREYRRAGCFSRSYHYLDTRGRPHELKHPRITRMKCWPDE